MCRRVARLNVGGNEHRAQLSVIASTRNAGLVGATVLSGRSGFRLGLVFYEHHSLGIGENLAIVSKLVDAKANLWAFLYMLEDLQGIAIATLETVEIVMTGLGD